MKILIAPAKTMKPCPNHNGTSPIFEIKAMEIIDEILNMSPLALSNFYKTSSDKALKYQEMTKDPTTYPAIDFYNGVVFKQLKHRNNIDYVYILDALYGILRPYDLIQYYRLDYTLMPSLYAYYTPLINDILSVEDYIIDLSSKEFTKTLNHPHMIHIDFIIIKNRKVTRPSAIIKKCRGLFLNELLKDIHQDIKKIIIDDFIYDESLSTNNNYVYKKENFD